MGYRSEHRILKKIKMTKKYSEIVLTSLAIRETKIKITLMINVFLVRMPTINKIPQKMMVRMWVNRIHSVLRQLQTGEVTLV